MDLDIIFKPEVSSSELPENSVVAQTIQAVNGSSGVFNVTINPSSIQITCKLLHDILSLFVIFCLKLSSQDKEREILPGTK